MRLVSCMPRQDVSLPMTESVFPSCQRRDAQHPAGLDHVRVLHGWGVRLHDLGVLGTLALAVVLLGYCPEGITLLDRVHGQLRSLLLHLKIARVHLRDAN